jgi:YD repeat-containing protein
MTDRELCATRATGLAEKAFRRTAYDAFGNLVARTDGESAIVSYEYL